MNSNQLGRAVRWARRRAGMTQHELAEALRMPQPSIARIERGTVTPRAATLMAMLEATGHRLSVEPLEPPPDLAGARHRLGMNVPARTWQALGKATASNPRTSPIRILRRLRRFGVPFVMIGDLAEVAHGAPISVGRVIEVCIEATDAARERLRMALDDLGAKSSDGVDFKADAGHLFVRPHTAAGDDYQRLVGNAVRLPVDAGVLVRVAGIEDLARARLARGREGDREAARLLRAIADWVNR